MICKGVGNQWVNTIIFKYTIYWVNLIKINYKFIIYANVTVNPLIVSYNCHLLI